MHFPESGPLGHGRAGSPAAGGRGQIARFGRCRSGQEMPVEQFAAPHAHAHDPLVAPPPGFGFHPAGQIELGHAFPDEAAGGTGYFIRKDGGLPHEPQFVRGFDSAYQANAVGDIHQFDAFEQPTIVQVKRGRDDVQFQAKDLRQGEALGCQKIGDFPGAAERHDGRKRRF